MCIFEFFIITSLRSCYCYSKCCYWFYSVTHRKISKYIWPHCLYLFIIMLLICLCEYSCCLLSGVQSRCEHFKALLLDCCSPTFSLDLCHPRISLAKNREPLPPDKLSISAIDSNDWNGCDCPHHWNYTSSNYSRYVCWISYKLFSFLSSLEHRGPPSGTNSAKQSPALQHRPIGPVPASSVPNDRYKVFFFLDCRMIQ